MCLVEIESKTKKYKEKNKIYKFYKLYYAVSVYNEELSVTGKNYLRTIYQWNHIYDHGIIIAEGELEPITTEINTETYDWSIKNIINVICNKSTLKKHNVQVEKIFYGGCIHAYVSKREAEKHNFHSDGYILIPVYVKSEDIIAAGSDGDICFKKYELLKKDWDEVFNKGN
jgi:hypothetical protein